VRPCGPRHLREAPARAPAPDYDDPTVWLPCRADHYARDLANTVIDDTNRPLSRTATVGLTATIGLDRWRANRRCGRSSPLFVGDISLRLPEQRLEVAFG
jgi:hypothetical protein